jgi:site-specific DNA-methyltransferase (adenine-specific)
VQKWDRDWTDPELYEIYGLTDEEIDFVERGIRPMQSGSVVE